jgi:hypothetical protein
VWRPVWLMSLHSCYFLYLPSPFSSLIPFPQWKRSFIQEWGGAFLFERRTCCPFPPHPLPHLRNDYWAWEMVQRGERVLGLPSHRDEGPLSQGTSEQAQPENYWTHPSGSSSPGQLLASALSSGLASGPISTIPCPAISWLSGPAWPPALMCTSFVPGSGSK